MDKGNVREIPITLTEYLDTTKSKVREGGRVESEQPHKEFLRVWLVSHKFETHAESWLLVETSFKAGQEKYYTYLPKAGIQDREGKWWMLSHEYHCTNDRMEHWFASYIEDYNYADSNWGYDINFLEL